MTTETDSKRAWLSLKDMVDEYPFPAATLYGWRHRGLGPKSVRLGKRVMYRRSDVEAWIAEHERAERTSER